MLSHDIGGDRSTDEIDLACFETLCTEPLNTDTPVSPFAESNSVVSEETGYAREDCSAYVSKENLIQTIQGDFPNLLIVSSHGIQEGHQILHSGSCPWIQGTLKV